MRNIIVTTPKSEMANSAQEAAECIEAGGGPEVCYYRRISSSIYGTLHADLKPGLSRVFYVEDGYMRGFAVAEQAKYLTRTAVEEAMGVGFQPGFYVIMRADSWKWIKPIAMRGFQGWRYFDRPVDIVGGWLDPRPEIESTLSSAKAPHILR